MDDPIADRYVTADEKGSIHLCAELLGHPRPHQRYRVEREGERLTLHPSRDETVPASDEAAWRASTPEERVAAIERWAARLAAQQEDPDGGQGQPDGSPPERGV